MANFFSTLLSNVRTNLALLEGVLVSALSVQVLVVNFIGTALPAEQKLVADIFAGVAVAALLIKNFLANTAAAKKAAKRAAKR